MAMPSDFDDVTMRTDEDQLIWRDSGIPTDVHIEVVTGYQDHLRQVDIPAWESGRGDWFTIQLFNLMAKADGQNFSKLETVFPEEASAWLWWFNSKPEYRVF